MKRILVVVTSVIALVLGMSLTAQAAGPDARSIIMAKTKADAVQVVSPQTVGSLTVGTGRVQSGDPLESWKQSTATGVRMMAILTDASQTAVDFALGIPTGAEVKKMPDGGMVVISNPAGPNAGLEARGTISAPWAVDARGRNLPTSYTYADGVLTQSVDTSGAAFPVVVDPELNFGWGVYFSLYGFEIKAVMSLVIAGGGGALIAACLGSKLPSIVAKIVMVLCTVIGGPSVLSLLKSIYYYWRVRTVNTYWCYQKEILPNIGGWVAVARAYPYQPSNCHV